MVRRFRRREEDAEALCRGRRKVKKNGIFCLFSFRPLCLTLRRKKRGKKTRKKLGNFSRSFSLVTRPSPAGGGATTRARGTSATRSPLQSYERGDRAEDGGAAWAWTMLGSPPSLRRRQRSSSAERRPRRALSAAADDLNLLSGFFFPRSCSSSWPPSTTTTKDPFTSYHGPQACRCPARRRSSRSSWLLRLLPLPSSSLVSAAPSSLPLPRQRARRARLGAASAASPYCSPARRPAAGSPRLWCGLPSTRGPRLG